MKVGDMVYAAVWGGPDGPWETGLVVNMSLEWPNVEVMWTNGLIFVESVELLEVVNETR